MTRKLKGRFGIIIVLFLMLFFFGCNNFQNTGKSNEYEDNLEKEDEADIFPSKSIQIVVPFSPGGGTDSVARALADSGKKYFSQPVVVVNKEGDGGGVGMSEGANSNPDGYTITMITVELSTLPNLGISPFTYRDFKPIVQLNGDPAALTVRADAPWDNVEDFIEYTRQHPNSVKVGNSGEGAIWHLASLLIENKTGVKFNHMFFDGAAPAVVSLLGGHVDAVTVSPAEVLPHVKNNQLKVLGVLSPNRIESLPEVKTFVEQDYDFVIGTWRGLGVPKNTPDHIVKILEAGFLEAAKDSNFIQIMNRLELGYKVAGSKEFLQIIVENDNLIKDLIEDLNIKK